MGVVTSMGLLLDTHVVVWLVTNPGRLRPVVLDVLADSRQVLFVSAISAYEVAQKVRLGKWPQAESLSLDWDELVASTDALSLPLESADALMAGRLSWDHRDPFDRLIAAQAMRRGYQLVSADRVFRSLDGLLLLSACRGRAGFGP